MHGVMRIDIFSMTTEQEVLSVSELSGRGWIPTLLIAYWIEDAGYWVENSIIVE